MLGYEFVWQPKVPKHGWSLVLFGGTFSKTQMPQGGRVHRPTNWKWLSKPKNWGLWKDSIPGTSDSPHLVSVTVFKTMWTNNNNLVILIYDWSSEAKDGNPAVIFQDIGGFAWGRMGNRERKDGKRRPWFSHEGTWKGLTERKRNPKGEEGGKFRSENGQIFSRTV